MDILLGEKDFANRVPIETFLRESGHHVVTLDNGLACAKSISQGKGINIALLSNNLEKLRGLDICRFLSATEKKSNCYVILMVESASISDLAKFRNAGVDDVLYMPFDPVQLAMRLDNAIRFIEYQKEINFYKQIAQTLAAHESPMQERAQVLKQNNIQLLKGAGGNKSTSNATTNKTPTKKQISDGLRPGRQKPKPITPSAPSNKGISFTTSDDELANNLSANKPKVADLPSNNATQIEENKDNNSNTEVSEDEALEVIETVQAVELNQDFDDPIILPFEFDDLSLNVFEGMGTVLKPQIPPLQVTDEEECFITYIGLASTNEGVWLDCIMEASRDAAMAVSGHILGETTPSDEDSIEMMSELMNMLQGSIKTHFEEKDIVCLALSIPNSKIIKGPLKYDPDKLLVDSGFTFDGKGINLYLLEHRETEERSKLDEVESCDFVTMDVEQQDGDKFNPLRAGTFIKPNMVDDIKMTQSDVKPFTVVRPSPTAIELDLLLKQAL